MLVLQLLRESLRERSISCIRAPSVPLPDVDASKWTKITKARTCTLAEPTRRHRKRPRCDRRNAGSQRRAGNRAGRCASGERAGRRSSELAESTKSRHGGRSEQSWEHALERFACSRRQADARHAVSPTVDRGAPGLCLASALVPNNRFANLPRALRWRLCSPGQVRQSHLDILQRFSYIFTKTNSNRYNTDRRDQRSPSGRHMYERE